MNRLMLLYLIAVTGLFTSLPSYAGVVIGGDRLTDKSIPSIKFKCTESNIIVSAGPDITSVGLLGIIPVSGKTTIRDIDGTSIEQIWEMKFYDHQQFSRLAKQCGEFTLTKYREWLGLQEKTESFEMVEPFDKCMASKNLTQLNRRDTAPSAFYIGLSYRYDRGTLGGKFHVNKAETDLLALIFALKSCCDELRKTESVEIQKSKSRPDSVGWASEGTFTSIKDFADSFRTCVIKRGYDAEAIK